MRAWICAIFGICASAAADWTHLAHAPDRVSVGPDVPMSLAAPAWVAERDEQGRAVTFVGQSSVVVSGDRVVALGWSDGAARMFTFDAPSGLPLWSAPIPEPVFDSRSTPAIDAGNDAVVVASGDRVLALALADGAALWSATLSGDIVNASPAVTDDLGPGDRVFATDYSGFFAGGRLYCINADPFDAAANPYQPGQILWSVEIGATSGDTPGYRDRVVYVASADEPGAILAYPAEATSTPDPLWETIIADSEGFYGGVCVSAQGVYAATYGFWGGLFAGRLVKLDAATGQVLWSVPCNRTTTIPVPLGGGLIAVSGGVDGYGSAPSVSLFHDQGSSAQLLWDTAQDTWRDADGDGAIDPGEAARIGGWTVQPAALGGARLCVGELSASGDIGDACTALLLLDPARAPGQTGFITDRFDGAGSSPALSRGALYTIGAAGLHAFASCRADFNGDGIVSSQDFILFLNAFVAANPTADIDGNGSVNSQDFIAFLNLFVAGC